MHQISLRSTVAERLTGPDKAGSVGPWMAITGVPTAAAMCMGPLSPLISKFARFRRATSWGRLVLPARLMARSCIWCVTHSMSGISPGAPVNMTWAFCPRISLSIRVAQWGMGQRLDCPLFELMWQAMTGFSGTIPSRSNSCWSCCCASGSTYKCGMRSAVLVIAPAALANSRQ